MLARLSHAVLELHLQGLQEAVDKFVSDELYDLYSKGVRTCVTLRITL
jgi:hypothetical protein